jgi:hypothetical protein
VPVSGLERRAHSGHRVLRLNRATHRSGLGRSSRLRQHYHCTSLAIDRWSWR